MVLKMLENIKMIDGFVVDQSSDDFSQEMQGLFYGERYIIVNHCDNSITFKLQDGPIKERGFNGCQVDQIVHVAKLIIDGLDKKLPCMANKMAVQGLGEVLTWLRIRHDDRVTRGVEGRNTDSSISKRSNSLEQALRAMVDAFQLDVEVFTEEQIQAIILTEKILNPSHFTDRKGHSMGLNEEEILYNARKREKAEKMKFIKKTIDEARASLDKQREAQEELNQIDEDIKTDLKLYNDTIRLYGAESQMMMAMEECGELITAISHFIRRRPGAGCNLVEEIADVEIMLDQLRLMVGPTNVDECKAFKKQLLCDKVYEELRARKRRIDSKKKER